MKLRRIMGERNVIRECLNFRIDESPEGEFNETIVAAASTLERKQNARQTLQKMRVRVEKGYFYFNRPLGYEYIKLKDGGKMLSPDANGPIVKDALEGYATGRFQTISEVKRFFDNYPSTNRTGNPDGIPWQTVDNVLRNPLYAGYMNIKSWGLNMLPCKHEPLIDFRTWEKNQERLDGKQERRCARTWTTISSCAAWCAAPAATRP